MDAITPAVARRAIHAGWPMRVGRKLARTLYLHHPGDDPATGAGVCIGIVDNELLAAEITRRWNTAAPDQIPAMLDALTEETP